MTALLADKKILVLVANGVDESAMSTLQRELIKAKAHITTVGVEPGLVNSWNETTWGLFFPVDKPITQTLGADYDCLVVPSGRRSIEKLSATPHSERILTGFMKSGKAITLMGDAVELLAKANLASGLKVSGPAELMENMNQSGATWIDNETVHDQGIMTGDSAADVPAFIDQIMDHLASHIVDEEPMPAAA